MNIYRVVGVMSGTSLDGLDLAYCHFYYQEGKWCFKLIQSKTFTYTRTWVEKLRGGIYLSAQKLFELNVEYSKLIGKKVKEFINIHQLEVDFIASHGHTIFHQPDKSFTYQIGSPQNIAIEAAIKVISDFRNKDIALGGQGAPLVPIGDQYLFSQYTACLNLGGIANVSFQVKNKRVAHDIGIANILFNYLANKKNKPYDSSGLIARSGVVSGLLLKKLNSLRYFNLSYPKSLGYEWFLSAMLPIINNSKSTIEDKMCTAVEHIALQIGSVLKDNLDTSGKILITGGGAFNHFLIERIKFYTPNHLKFILPTADIIDFKEAIVFAFLGVLCERREINCLNSVTGARQNSCGGNIYYPS